MKEPEKIPLNPNTPKSKTVNTISMPSSVKMLYDDFGYYSAIEIKNENTKESTET